MTATDVMTREKTALKAPSLWTVTLRNDDYTPMDFVVRLLMHVFHLSLNEAEDVMLTIHEKGAANVGSYSKEVAVMKAKQCLEQAEHHGHPLLAEPQPLA